MQSMSARFLFVVLASVAFAPRFASAVAASGRGSRISSSLSPVTRVVELLKDLSKKIEAEGKTEESLFEKFTCWAKGVVSEKTQAIEAAELRAAELGRYIKDIDAGRVEFTSERTDLEKSLADLNTDIESANSLRAKEKGEYEDATAEMDKAIAALESAIETLKTATDDHKEGTLLALRGRLRNTMGFAARSVAGERLAFAVTLGDKFLDKGDALFLRRLLTGGAEDPADRAEWKDLNRKATFKMSYKARSFKIQGVLEKLLKTFSDSRAQADSKEGDAIALYEKLIGTKSEMKAKDEEALLVMEKEGGVKGLSKAEAEEEKTDLEESISDDKKYIDQTKASMDSKTKEWKDRSTIRSGELEAVSKAIAILASDDARDTFKKSFTSQSYSLLQTTLGSSLAAKRLQGRQAAQILDKAATGDDRLAALARAAAAAGGHFDQVVEAIDKMVENLKAEEISDSQQKEKCEKTRMDDTRTAAVKSRSMDDMTDSITALKAEIKEIEAEVASMEAEIAKNEAQLKKATELRADEKAAFEVSKKDDEAALALVNSASDVLAKFYEGIPALAQTSASQAGGQAPVPPPATWDKATYGGKTGESTGIVALLKMIGDDIDKDITKSTEEEDLAQAHYDELKSDINKANRDLQASITEKMDTKAGKEGEVQETQSDHKDTGTLLSTVMKKIADEQPGCDYFTINYPVRLKNRQTEVDGLEKAKVILTGGSFATPADEGREIKPGDALLQQRLG